MSQYQHLFDKLNGFFDTLYESGCLLESEEEEMNELNDDIIHLIKSQEETVGRLENELAAARGTGCLNTRCSHNLGGTKCALSVILDNQGVCSNQNKEKQPYEECDTCLFDFRYCESRAGGRLCEDWEEGRE